MRLILMFDLPVETKEERKIYRHYIKFLKNEGFIRIQYSIYSKLCINKDSASTVMRHIRVKSPKIGDVRFLMITENQYQGIVNVNDNHSLQEQITTMDRILMIGGMNNED